MFFLSPSGSGYSLVLKLRGGPVVWYIEPMQVILKLSELSMIFEGGEKNTAKEGKRRGE